LALFLIGVTIFCFGTFIYELSHSYLLYKGLFNFVKPEIAPIRRRRSTFESQKL